MSGLRTTSTLRSKPAASRAVTYGPTSGSSTGAKRGRKPGQKNKEKNTDSGYHIQDESYDFGDTRSESLANADPAKELIIVMGDADNNQGIIDTVEGLDIAKDEIAQGIYDGSVPLESFNGKAGQLTLYPIQQTVVELFTRHFHEGIMAFESPMASGKTLIAAAIGMRCRACVIVVTGHTIMEELWIPELLKYGLLNLGNAEVSEFLIFDKKAAPVHYNYLESVIRNPEIHMRTLDDGSKMAWPMRILVGDTSSKTDYMSVKGVKKDPNSEHNKTALERTMDHFWEVGYGRRNNEEKRAGEEVEPGRRVVAIVDEAHKKRPAIIKSIQENMHLHRYAESFELADEIIHIGKEFLMSGSPINERTNGFSNRDHKSFEILEYGIKKPNYGYHIDVKITNRVTGDIPHMTWNIDKMPSSNPSEDPKGVWLKRMREICRLDGDAVNERIVLCCEQKHYDIMAKAGIFGRRALFQIDKSKSVQNFNQTRNAVLLIKPRSKVEGFNINADAVVIFFASDDEGTISPQMERIKQIVARIARPGSSYRAKGVQSYMLCGTFKEYLRAFYAKAFNYLPWNFGYQEGEINYAAIVTAVSLLRFIAENRPEDSAGATLPELNPVDLCLLLADYNELYESGFTPEGLLFWWWSNTLKNDYETIFTIDDIINKLYWLAPYKEALAAREAYEAGFPLYNTDFLDNEPVDALDLTPEEIEANNNAVLNQQDFTDILEDIPAGDADPFRDTSDYTEAELEEAINKDEEAELQNDSVITVGDFTYIYNDGIYYDVETKEAYERVGDAMQPLED